MAEIPVLLPISETLSAAWEKVKGAKGSIWLALILFFIIYVALEMINGVLVYAIPSIEGFPEFIIQIIVILLQAGIIYLGILRAFDLPFSFEKMFYPFNFKLALKLIGSYIVQFLIQVIVFFIFLIPSLLMVASENSTIATIRTIGLLLGFAVMIYLGIRMYFAVAFVLDRGAWPIQSIKLSFQATRSNFWRTLAVVLISSIIIILSAIPLGIGLIWTLPWCYIVYGVMYRKLIGNITNP